MKNILKKLLVTGFTVLTLSACGGGGGGGPIGGNVNSGGRGAPPVAIIKKNDNNIKIGAASAPVNASAVILTELSNTDNTDNTDTYTLPHREMLITSNTSPSTLPSGTLALKTKLRSAVLFYAEGENNEHDLLAFGSAFDDTGIEYINTLTGIYEYKGIQFISQITDGKFIKEKRPGDSGLYYPRYGNFKLTINDGNEINYIGNKNGQEVPDGYNLTFIGSLDQTNGLITFGRDSDEFKLTKNNNSSGDLYSSTNAIIHAKIYGGDASGIAGIFLTNDNRYAGGFLGGSGQKQIISDIPDGNQISNYNFGTGALGILNNGDSENNNITFLAGQNYDSMYKNKTNDLLSENRNSLRLLTLNTDNPDTAYNDNNVKLIIFNDLIVVGGQNNNPISVNDSDILIGDYTFEGKYYLSDISESESDWDTGIINPSGNNFTLNIMDNRVIVNFMRTTSSTTMPNLDFTTGLVNRKTGRLHYYSQDGYKFEGKVYNSNTSGSNNSPNNSPSVAGIILNTQSGGSTYAGGFIGKGPEMIDDILENYGEINNYNLKGNRNNAISGLDNFSGYIIRKDIRTDTESANVFTRGNSASNDISDMVLEPTTNRSTLLRTHSRLVDTAEAYIVGGTKFETKAEGPYKYTGNQYMLDTEKSSPFTIIANFGTENTFNYYNKRLFVEDADIIDATGTITLSSGTFDIDNAVLFKNDTKSLHGAAVKGKFHGTNGVSGIIIDNSNNNAIGLFAETDYEPYVSSLSRSKKVNIHSNHLDSIDSLSKLRDTVFRLNPPESEDEAMKYETDNSEYRSGQIILQNTPVKARLWMNEIDNRLFMFLTDGGTPDDDTDDKYYILGAGNDSEPINRPEHLDNMAYKPYPYKGDIISSNYTNPDVDGFSFNVDFSSRITGKMSGFDAPATESRKRLLQDTDSTIDINMYTGKFTTAEGPDIGKIKYKSSSDEPVSVFGQFYDIGTGADKGAKGVSGHWCVGGTNDNGCIGDNGAFIGNR